MLTVTTCVAGMKLIKQLRNCKNVKSNEDQENDDLKEKKDNDTTSITLEELGNRLRTSEN